MKKTLNNLALTSFERRARETNATVVDCTKYNIDFDGLIGKGKSIILWSTENGFQETGCACEMRLVDAIFFGDKYENDHVFHFGVYNPEFNYISVFRAYDQIHSGKDMHVYDLRFLVDEYLSAENLDEYDYMSYITSLCGRASCG